MKSIGAYKACVYSIYDINRYHVGYCSVRLFIFACQLMKMHQCASTRVLLPSIFSSDQASPTHNKVNSRLRRLSLFKR